MHKNENVNKVIDIVRWMNTHPEMQQKLCCENCKVEAEESIEIINILEKVDFYEMIYIFLIKNKHNLIISNAINKLLIEILAKEWEEVGNRQMCKKVKENIEQEMFLAGIKQKNDPFNERS